MALFGMLAMRSCISIGVVYIWPLMGAAEGLLCIVKRADATVCDNVSVL